ncbi:TKL protein kinase [Fonticula alba]|uniref:TKL protein kinase n=1 Tax=Fonticula alba TaxID=691883 RepID=A0A058Z4B7_FONAL|nr:TKL protein kinase [Fonticula alba]KCV68768.1 TKL protein kinase [Fonticula alba]|eukprot:XP_009497200.1 TKL protein kinase [Fonticula alba]
MAPRLALWLVACLGVCAGRLAAVGAAPAPHATQEPEIVTLPQSITLYYHQLASSWAPRPDTILGNAPVFHGSEGTSLARVDPANASVMVVHQREMDLSDHSDHRLGGSFGLVTPLRFGPVATFNPLTTRPVVSPSRDGPMLLFFMENSIQALIEGTWQGHSLSPSQSILAWHSLGSKFLQVLLFDSSSDHLLVLALSHGQSPAVLPAMGLSPGVARERLHAVSGVGPSFVFWFDDIFGVVALPWGGAVILGSSDTPPGGTIVDLAASTILNSDQGDIALLHQDRVSVCLNHTPLAECETWFHVARPPGLMPGSAARLYLPAPGSLHEPVKSILFQDTGTGQLWWLHFDTLRRSPSSWQRLLLPNGLALSEIVALRPVRLAIRPGFSTWGVGNAVDAFVASGDFLCIEDSSILCGRPSEPRGYACAPGWAPSHGLFPGQLCGACLSGHRRIGQYGAPASCSPCAGPHCRQCLDHQGCVLCEEGFVLFLDPSTRVSTCLDSCPAGYSSMASGGWRCLPTDRAIPPPGIRPQTIVLSDFPASPVEFFVPSLLCSVNGVMHLLPENRSPSLLEQNLLAFRSTSQSAPLWIRVAHDGSLTSSTMDGWPFSQAGPGTSPPAAQSYVEVVLASQGSGPRILSVLCDRTGNLRVARMECRHRPPTEDDPCEVAYFWEFDRQVGCLSVGLLGKDIVSIVMTSDVKPTHIMPVSSTGSALDLWPLSGMHGHPVEFPVGWFPRDSPLGDWAFAMPKPGTQARVLPAAMLRKMDSRVAGFPGATLHPPPSGYEPILLATGLRRSDGLGEFFLAGLAQSGDGPMLWEVWHFPAPGRDTGLIVSMPHRREILGQLPSGFSQPGDNPQGRFFSLALAPESEYPAAMLLVTRRMVGWARLYCPMGPGERVHCWLEPASFAMLDRDINALPMVNVLPLPAGVAEAQLGPSPSRAVFMADGSANIRVLLLDDGAPCVAGTEGPLCQPCDSLCLACSASGPEACTACRLSPFDRPGVCVDACPEGLIESGNVCVCAGGCVDCASLGHPHEEYHCRACPPRMAPLGGTCQPCHSSCTICTAPGNPSACVFCSVGSFGTLDGRCLASCPEGTWADIPNAACWPCPTGCTQCVSGSQCTVCSDRRFLAPGGQCERCEDSCASCENAASCTDCQPGLVFLDTNPMVASLCGSTCAPGEYVGTERCMACGPTCALCAGAGDACAVCAAGHRWSGAPPAAGATGACVPCPDGCDSCTASRCLACEQGLFLDRHEGCVQACPLGTYNDGPTGTCQPCDVSCAACAGGLAGECTGCAAGLELVATEPGLGTCPPGQYAADAELGGQVCRACDGTCLECSGPGPAKCSACPPGLMLHEGRCVGSCPVGMFECLLAGRCEACPAGCTACTVAEESPVGCAAACSACQGGLFLSFATGECLPGCPPGEYALAGAFSCARCHASCRSCFEREQFCTSCPSDEAWLDYEAGVCLSACPERPVAEVEFPNALPPAPKRACLPCPDGCDRCRPRSPVPECVFDATGGLGCPAMASCDLCATGLLLLQGSACVSVCPEGFFADVAEVPPTCSPCHRKCSSCVGPEAEDCTDRSPGSRRLALGLGIGLGVLLVLLLLLVVLFLLWRVRQQRSALNKPPAGDDENATVLNTMVELSLPGSILVDIGQNFAPLAGDGLGAGTQARVFAARAVGAGTSDRLGCPAVVAIKQLKTDRLTASQGLLFQNEVALMWLLRDHGNIVRLYGYSETPPAIIMDRFDTDLGLLLHSEAVIEDAVLLDIIQQWATGLEAMHTQGVAHRDLKPGNVLVSQRPGGRWHAALGDLGASRNLNTDRSSALVTDAPALNALTARYAAPEVLTAVQRRRGLEMELLLPADIFSAAIMLWECLTRTTPWAGKTFEEITADVLFGHRPDLGALRTESNTPQVDLLQMAWDANPHVRPVAASFRQKCAMQAALHR